MDPVTSSCYPATDPQVDDMQLKAKKLRFQGREIDLETQRGILGFSGVVGAVILTPKAVALGGNKLIPEVIQKAHKAYAHPSSERLGATLKWRGYQVTIDDCSMDCAACGLGKTPTGKNRLEKPSSGPQQQETWDSKLKEPQVEKHVQVSDANTPRLSMTKCKLTSLSLPWD